MVPHPLTWGETPCFQDQPLGVLSVGTLGQMGKRRTGVGNLLGGAGSDMEKQKPILRQSCLDRELSWALLGRDWGGS